MRCVAWLGSLVLASACGSPPPATTPATPASPPPSPDAGIVSAPTPPPPPVDAAPVAAAPADAAPVIPDALQQPPKVEGRDVRIKNDETKALYGVLIEFGKSRHKHYVGGGTTGIYPFAFRRQGKRIELELRTDDVPFQAEVAAHGEVFVLVHVSYTEFDVIHVKGNPKPLSEDACVARIEAGATSAGLPASSSHSASTDDGVLVLRTDTWRGYCGLYTKRVWFGPPPRERP